jgi:DNA-binding response OmpR family regulator
MSTHPTYMSKFIVADNDDAPMDLSAAINSLVALNFKKQQQTESTVVKPPSPPQIQVRLAPQVFEASYASIHSQVTHLNLSGPAVKSSGVYQAGELQERPNSKPRIALLEDCPAEAEDLQNFFHANDFNIVVFNTSASLLEYLQRESFDLLLLDWNVPDINGFEVLKRLRHQMKLGCTVLMMSNRTSEYDIVQALNMGADDYVQKPWRPFELLARVNALIRRRHSKVVANEEIINEFRFNLNTSQVWRQDKVLNISPREFSLLYLFCKNLSCPVSRNHIIEVVWAEGAPEGRGLDVYVSRVRRKAGLIAENGYHLISVHKFGYKLESVDMKTSSPNLGNIRS